MGEKARSSCPIGVAAAGVPSKDGVASSRVSTDGVFHS
jgi:hypothetical protein